MLAEYVFIYNLMESFLLSDLRMDGLAGLSIGSEYLINLIMNMEKHYKST